MRHLAAILLLLMAGVLYAQHAWRGRLKAVKAEQPRERFDTLTPASLADIAISGYDKPLRSRHETFFVANNTADTLRRLYFDIVYTDMSDRGLHFRSDSVDLMLPPGATVNTGISTWDLQRAFYYHLSQPPKRVSGTPYKVKFTLTRALTPCHEK